MSCCFGPVAAQCNMVGVADKINLFPFWQEVKQKTDRKRVVSQYPFQKIPTLT